MKKQSIKLLHKKTAKNSTIFWETSIEKFVNFNLSYNLKKARASLFSSFKCKKINLTRTVRVRVEVGAPETTEIEPELHICKRVCGFYLRKVKVKRQRV